MTIFEEKYKNILDVLYLDKDVSKNILSQVIEHCVEYISNKYPNVSKNHKVAAVYVVIQIYKKDSTMTSSPSDIDKIIDEFMEYKDTYNDYINLFALVTDQFDLEMSFYKKFVNDNIVS